MRNPAVSTTSVHKCGLRRARRGEIRCGATPYIDFTGASVKRNGGFVRGLESEALRPRFGVVGLPCVLQAQRLVADVAGSNKWQPSAASAAVRTGWLVKKKSYAGIGPARAESYR
jgi:hypothetical protein